MFACPSTGCKFVAYSSNMVNKFTHSSKTAAGPYLALTGSVQPLKQAERFVDTQFTSILTSTTAGSRFFFSREPAVFLRFGRQIPRSHGHRP